VTHSGPDTSYPDRWFFILLSTSN